MIVRRARLTLDLTSAISRGFASIHSSGSSHSEVTLGEFARSAQKEFQLPQPETPLAFQDVHPGDPDYAAAEAIYPYLHRRLLCPGCAPDARFAATSVLTRGQSAVALVSILASQGRLELLTPDETAQALAAVSDAEALPVVVRPYLATAVKNGILTLAPGGRLLAAQPCLRGELGAALDTARLRFPPATTRAVSRG